MTAPRLAYAEEFDSYLKQPLIASVADQKRWTVSDKNKVPIDMQTLLYGTPPRVQGARKADETCLVDRTTLTNAYAALGAGAPNHAFYLDISKHDPFIVLDIEPSCPPELSQRLFESMPWVYAERSMSGQGFHLIIPTPWSTTHGPGFLSYLYEEGSEELDDASEELWFELIERLVLRHPEGHYEFLLQHYATFTFVSDGLPAPPPMTAEQARVAYTLMKQTLKAAPPPTKKLEYTTASGQRKDLIVHPEHPEHIAYNDLLTFLRRMYRKYPYSKTVADFHNDASRWEYGLINHVLWLARSAIRDGLGIGNRKTTRGPIDENVFIWLVYEVVAENTPQRPKHYTTRSGLPYLLYRTKSAFPQHAPKIDKRVFESKADAASTENR